MQYDLSSPEDLAGQGIWREFVEKGTNENPVWPSGAGRKAEKETAARSGNRFGKDGNQEQRRLAGERNDWRRIEKEAESIQGCSALEKDLRLPPFSFAQ